MELHTLHFTFQSAKRVLSTKKQTMLLIQHYITLKLKSITK